MKKISLILLLSAACLVARAQEPAISENSSEMIAEEMTPATLNLTLGKTIRVPAVGHITRVTVGNPEIADVSMVRGKELYLVGKKIGNTNIYLWSRGGKVSTIDAIVSIDVVGLRDTLTSLMPKETDIKVAAAGESFVLTGLMTDAVSVRQAVLLAEQFGGKKVINMLSSSDVPQVMLEVKIAEVQKNQDDKLGASLTTGNAGVSAALGFGFAPAAAGVITFGKGIANLTLQAEINNGRAKILAEPNIVAVSGQEASFLSGGKIFLPIPQSIGGIGGAAAIVLQEEEYGVGLKFLPTVLSGGLISLRVTPEVSELSATGTTFGTGGSTTILPTITTRRASTTIQLNDGESFAIGGLIKNNVTEAIKAFPVLGELPILGALFRSTEFQTDRTELVFVVTVRLVKPTKRTIPLPTDTSVDPSRVEFQVNGQMEGGQP